MKPLVLFFAFVINFYPAFSQPGGGGRQPGQQPMGRFYGKVVEAKTGKPLEYASVQLVQNRMDTATKKRKEVVIAGMITRANGEFSLENIPVFAPSKLVITVVGFQSFEQNVSFDIKPGGGNNGDFGSMLSALDKDLGNIKIEIQEKTMENVTVVAEKPGLQLGIDRKVFNVDKNLVSAGGTAVDIMRNVPSLNVDIDGNVTLRNNTPQIFVDGRPTTMELDQIPAEAIESVEIITNPSAKFDASGGTAGILNIILKKNKKVGYSGNVRASIDARARIGLGGDINLRQNKINLFASSNYNQRRSISRGYTERLSIFDNPDNLLRQTDRSVVNGDMFFNRFGMDYFINNRSTLTASVNLGSGRFRPNTTSDLFVDTLHTMMTTSLTKRYSSIKREFNNLGSTIGFKHNFPKAGRELTADINYNTRKGPNDNLVVTDVYKPDLITKDNSLRQRQIGNNRGRNIVFQTDFTNPLSEKSKLELGVRAAFNDNTSTNAFYLVDPSGQLILQPASEINYESNERVLAAYTTFSNKIKNFGYQLGLRVESSQYKGVLTKTNENFDIDFPVSLFPSIFLSQKMKENQELQFNYSRRINRPNFWQLSPFTDSSDFLNLSKGNPGLTPEFTNSFELSYQKVFKNRDNLLMSLFYKSTTNLISRFQEIQTEPGTGKELVMNTYINANSSYITGLEITLKNNLTKWWELTSNLNLFTSKIDIDNPSIKEQEPFASWLLKLNNNFKATKKLSIQFSGSYQSKTILPPGGSGGGSGFGGSGGGGGGGRGGGGPMGMFGQSISAQGFVRPVYFADLGIRYTFLKDNRASISVNWSDIFRTRVSDVRAESPFFIQDVFRRRDPQLVRVNFSWRFGKFDTNLFKRKNNREQDNGSDMMGGMGG